MRNSPQSIYISVAEDQKTRVKIKVKNGTSSRVKRAKKFNISQKPIWSFVLNSPDHEGLCRHHSPVISGFGLPGASEA